MNPDATDFKLAIERYSFPDEEPIYHVPFALPTCDLSVYRSSHGPMPPHSTLAEFWASALYDFLESYGEDDRFEGLGASGLYLPLDHASADRLIGEMVAGSRSDHISVPQHVESCYLVRQAPDLSMAVGVDRSGFFATFSRVRPG